MMSLVLKQRKTVTTKKATMVGQASEKQARVMRKTRIKSSAT